MENFLQIRVGERHKEAQDEANRITALFAQLHAISKQVEEYYNKRTSNIISTAIDNKTLMIIGVNNSEFMSVTIVHREVFRYRITGKNEEVVNLKGLADAILDNIPD